MAMASTPGVEFLAGKGEAVGADLVEPPDQPVTLRCSGIERPNFRVGHPGQQRSAGGASVRCEPPTDVAHHPEVVGAGEVGDRRDFAPLAQRDVAGMPEALRDLGHHLACPADHAQRIAERRREVQHHPSRPMSPRVADRLEHPCIPHRLEQPRGIRLRHVEPRRHLAHGKIRASGSEKSQDVRSALEYGHRHVVPLLDNSHFIYLQLIDQFADSMKQEMQLRFRKSKQIASLLSISATPRQNATSISESDR